MFNGLECHKHWLKQILVICALVSAHEKLDILTGPNSDDCSRLFFKLKTVFLSRKDFFNSKGVGLEKESNYKNIN